MGRTVVIDDGFILEPWYVKGKSVEALVLDVLVICSEWLKICLDRLRRN